MSAGAREEACDFARSAAGDDWGTVENLGRLPPFVDCLTAQDLEMLARLDQTGDEIQTRRKGDWSNLLLVRELWSSNPAAISADFCSFSSPIRRAFETLCEQDRRLCQSRTWDIQ